MSNLEELDLSSNSIENIKGFERLSVLGKLKILDLGYNLFKTLYLSDNINLDGSRGFERLSVLGKLEVLRLDMNSFKNSILPSLGVLSSLKTLSLSYNNLNGSIDIGELHNMSSLEELDLSSNDINNIKGLKSLSKLKMLNLRSNKLKGLVTSDAWLAQPLSLSLTGTKNVIDACVDLKVKRLIYTSCPSVVFDGVHGIINGDESLPYPAKDGLRRTIESYSHLRAECQPKKDGPSKAFIYLGRGRVADILLWRNKKETLTTVFILVSIYFNFIASGYTIIAMVSKLLLVAFVFLFIHSILPKKILGYTIEKIPVSKFYFSQEMSNEVALSMASSWNSAVNGLISLSKGNDWTLFLKVVLSLSILSFLGAISLQNLFVIGLPVVFVAFFVYEKKEEEIDGLIYQIISYGCKLKSNTARKFFNSKKIQ